MSNPNPREAKKKAFQTEIQIYRELKEIFPTIIYSQWGAFDFLCRKGGTWFLIEVKYCGKENYRVSFTRKNARICLDLIIRLKAIGIHIIKTNGKAYVIQGKKLFIIASQWKNPRKEIHMRRWLDYAENFEDWKKRIKEGRYFTKIDLNYKKAKEE